ncbi:MAG: hypothetical protein ACRDJM_00710 [Actinomycetota bacterium]
MTVADDLLASPRALAVLAAYAYSRTVQFRLADPSPAIGVLTSPPSRAGKLERGLDLEELGPPVYPEPDLIDDEAELADLVHSATSGWPWNSVRESITPRLLRGKELLRPAAERLAESRGARPWFLPLDPSAQIWVSREGVAPSASKFTPDLGPCRHSHVVRPARAFSTSTQRSFIPCSWLLDAWEGTPKPPFDLWRMPVREDTRVFEILGSRDWAHLVSTYPADTTDLHEHMLADYGITERPFLSPNWEAVARDYDGVHLSEIGRLTTESVPLSLGAGVCMLECWDTEATEWMRWVFDEPEYLGAYEGRR